MSVDESRLNERQWQLSISDMLDSQLESSDGRSIGRVADIEGHWNEDGSFTLTHLVTGPQALWGRVGRPLERVARWVLRDRFEERIQMNEVEEFGPTIRLKREAVAYKTGQSERWVAKHVLRWIPGSGYKA